MGNQKRISFARIKIDKSQQESFELIKKILDELDLQKWKEKTIDEQNHYIFCRPKLGLIHNNVTNNFYIFAKPNGRNSVIDIYFDLVTFDVVTNQVIDPFHKRLSEIFREYLTMDLKILESITYEEIEATSNQDVGSSSTSDDVSSVADEIAKLAKLRTDGAISEEEFQKMKNDLIEKM
tara:strand:- start:704 stop:1240 length:537 start_codon:yes stop_codon:yes gene_type:complete